MIKYLVVILLMCNLMACTSEQNPREVGTNGAVAATETEDTTAESSKPMLENDLAKKNLRGKIESREVLVYEAKIKEGYVTNGAMKGGIKTTYNTFGNKVALVTYDEKKEVVSTWKYTYDDDNNLLEAAYSDEGVTRKTTYTYKDKKQLTTSDEYVNDKLVKQMTYTYDEAGNESENVASFVESKGKSKSKHAYDEKGLLRETNIYDEKEVLQLKQLYTYNEAGQEIQQSIFTGNNAPSYKRKSVYDAKGNKIKDAAFTGDGAVNPSDTYRYKYEYDENGNWTTKIRYNYNDVADQFIEQKITYSK
ncbi:MAG: Unknown protein [uncultured Aureispira sp.]|uniref:YD repeat-containing protein n=1 Tax=uncultured Aureispira sp. TaxID=1331704 RepID=A0A6S6T280_9BACT|nr:MAG: Unknown protein [uncultured Aureispira sp.]